MANRRFGNDRRDNKRGKRNRYGDNRGNRDDRERDRNRVNRRDEEARVSTHEAMPEDRLEGRNPIREALDAGRKINKVWVLRQQDGERYDKRLADLARDCKDDGAVIMEVDRDTLNGMAVTNQHQGIIAQVAAHNYVDYDTALNTLKESDEDAFILFLDEIQEGYNLGSILRIADAAGVDLIVLPERRSVSLDAHVAKASAGAIEHVPVARVTNLGRAIDDAKALGFWMFGTDVDPQAQEYDKVNWSGNIGLIIGNEGSGMSLKIKERCDYLITIPMRGQINSLNAAVATGVVVFEAVRQRHNKQ